MRSGSFIAALLAAGAMTAPFAAHAQSTTDNVTTQSSDAFGRAVGNGERSGLYSADDVRGFNPVDAGNVRIRGMYVDLIERVPTRLAEGSTVHVGIAAQHYPFPAPTGLVDYDINVPERDARFGFQIDNSSTQALGWGFSLQARVPFDNVRWGVFGSVGVRETERVEGGTQHNRALGATIAFRPRDDVEVLAFAGTNWSWSEEARATLFPAGTVPPPEIERGVFLGQNWTDRESRTSMIGGIVRAPLGPLRIEAALFDSRRDTPRSFSDNLIGVTPDGRASNRVVVATFGNMDESLSGEVRLTGGWKSGDFAHAVSFGVRAREKDRAFGGSQRIVLGASSAIAPDFRAAPAITPGPLNRDSVRQQTVGLAYTVTWRSTASLDVGISRSFYRKAVDFADTALPDPVTQESPWVGNVSGSFALTKWAIVYAGYARGIEEALIAPDTATNQSEAPPAVHSTQIEGGARIALSPRLTMVAGAFQITKPYFNLDPAARYRQLGTLRNTGIELSLAGSVAPGLNIVAGTLLLDPRIEGEAVDTGLIGPRPVGQVRRKSVLNLDWRLGAGKGPWSFDLSLESYAARVANNANTLSAPERATVNVGARYRLSLGHTRLVLRAQIQNLFDSYGWNVSASGGFTYVAPRYLALQVVGDL